MTDSTSSRPVAPDIEVSDDPFFDERNATTKRLNELYPECIHGYASSLSTEEHLRMRGLEVVKDKSGLPIRNGMDFVVRKNKELHKRQRFMQEEASAKMSEKIIGKEGQVRKKPKAKVRGDS